MSYSPSKLWGEPWFLSLSPESKLTYIYCATMPGINTLGLFASTPEAIASEVGISKPEFDKAFLKLYPKRIEVYEVDGVYWFHVTEYLNSFPQKGGRFEKGVKQFYELPGKLQDILLIGFKLPEMRIKEDFVPPTPQEVVEYGIEIGYLIDGHEFVNYYDEREWKDSRGKKVRNWKLKAKTVWAKKERKIHYHKDAPEGYEKFFLIHEGRAIFPKSWKNGLPFGDNIVEDTLLQDKFISCTKK